MLKIARKCRKMAKNRPKKGDKGLLGGGRKGKEGGKGEEGKKGGEKEKKWEFSCFLPFFRCSYKIFV